MQTYLLEREQVIPLPRPQVFAFFGDALNLQLITPPFLHFRVLTKSPVEMKVGTLLDYRLSLFGVGFYWQTLIEQWVPEESFVDRQVTGPYALWHHTHTFAEIAPHKTLMRDRVLYRLPYTVFGKAAHAVFVKRTLAKIFDYRKAMTARLLTPENPELDAITQAKFKNASIDANAPSPQRSLIL
jgi:ligand-binding SRPBCC domain-containing protein